MSKSTFVPLTHCTVASGECFEKGECLRDFRAQRERDLDKRIASLEANIRTLQQELQRLNAGTQKY